MKGGPLLLGTCWFLALFAVTLCVSLFTAWPRSFEQRHQHLSERQQTLFASLVETKRLSYPRTTSEVDGGEITRCVKAVIQRVESAQHALVADCGLGELRLAASADSVDAALAELPRCFAERNDAGLEDESFELSRLSKQFHYLAETHSALLLLDIRRSVLDFSILLARHADLTEQPTSLFALMHESLAHPRRLQRFEQALDIHDEIEALKVTSLPDLYRSIMTSFDALSSEDIEDISEISKARTGLRRHFEVGVRLRAAAIAMSELVSPSLEGDAPAALSDPHLSDPFTGEPLRFELVGDTLILWSTGPDGADEKATRVQRAAEMSDDDVFSMAIRGRTTETKRSDSDVALETPDT